MDIKYMRDFLASYYGAKKVATWHDNQVLAIYYKIVNKKRG